MEYFKWKAEYIGDKKRQRRNKDKSTKIWKCKVAGKTGEEKNYL